MTDNMPSQLFEQKVRIRETPLRQGENLYPFYDERIATGYDEYRAAVNSWITQLDNSDAAELISRFRSGDDQTYHAAMAELVVHACLIASGFHVSCHPSNVHETNRPDFLASGREGSIATVVEVTTFNPSRQQIGSDRIVAEIYNAIDRISIPRNCYLHFEIHKRSEITPPIKKLCTEILVWVNSIIKTDNLEQAHTLHLFEAAGWEIQIELLSGFKERRENTGAIGVFWPTGALILKTEDKIRASLNLKAKRYGRFKLPFVIVVADCSDELTGGEENKRVLTDALFGDETMSISVDENGRRKQRAGRAANGFWGLPNRPKNQNVSIVVLIPRATVWEFRDPKWQPIAFVNPYSELQPPANFLEFETLSVEGGKLKKRGGKNFADILDLQNPWPPI